MRGCNFSVKDKTRQNGKNGLNIQKIGKSFTIFYKSTLMRAIIACVKNVKYVLTSYKKFRILCLKAQITIKLFRITLEVRKFFAKKLMSKVPSKF